MLAFLTILLNHEFFAKSRYEAIIGQAPSKILVIWSIKHMVNNNFIIAGLGNPGAEYDGTRHNVGFDFLDYIGQENNFIINKEKWQAEYARVSLWGCKILFIKPLTYMNLSGRSIVKFAEFYKIPASQIIIAHDDLDLDVGMTKLVITGGPGGHNGIKSLIQCLGVRDFVRIKIGIGRPGKNNISKEIPVEKFVLGKIPKEDEKIIVGRFSELEKGLYEIVNGGIPKAMNIINRRR